MEPNDAFKSALLDRIATNRNRKLSVKIRTLVSEFRNERISRIHPAALDSVLKTLAAWGVAYTFPDGTSGNDYITLSVTAVVGTSPAQNEATPVRSASAARTGATGLERGQEYRILSIHPPWAWAIMFAGKNVENRSWTTPYRGPILIHASSKNYVGANLDEARRYIAECSGLSEREIPKVFPRRQILGFVDLVDCVERSRSPWAFAGEQHWLLERPRPLERPVANVDGKLNLWKWTAP